MILLVGSLGNMGRRYAKILDWINEPYYGIDIKESPWDYNIISKCDRAIIATPTENHFEWCKSLKIPWLCEKPISKDIRQVEEIADHCKKTGVKGNMVCNWLFAANTALLRAKFPPNHGVGGWRGGYGDVALMGDMDIHYDHWHTGRDGLAWDCIQLIHMANLDKLVLLNNSPVLDCSINGHMIDMDLIAESYLIMISQWLFGDGLWDMEDALTATNKVYEYMDRHPGP